MTAKTQRELALERALQVLWHSRCENKEIVADMLIGLIGQEGDRRAGRPEVTRQIFDGVEYVRDAAVIRKFTHLELVRMKLPPEVLAALRGA